MGDSKDIIIDIYTEIKNIFVNTTQINIEFASILESVEAERQYWVVSAARRSLTDYTNTFNLDLNDLIHFEQIIVKIKVWCHDGGAIKFNDITDKDICIALICAFLNIHYPYTIDSVLLDSFKNNADNTNSINEFNTYLHSHDIYEKITEIPCVNIHEFLILIVMYLPIIDV